MAADVRELTTDEELDRAESILEQLWTETPAAEIRAWFAEEGYRLLGLYDDGDLVGVAGCYVQVVLFHERTCWVHDLVVDEAHRSAGHGERLLGAVTEWAAERDCETVGLVSRLPNEDAIDFYDHTALEQFGYVYRCDAN